MPLPVSRRFVALLLPVIVAFATPGVALAHGVEHHREAEHRSSVPIALNGETAPAVEGVEGDVHEHPMLRADARGRASEARVPAMPAPRVDWTAPEALHVASQLPVEADRPLSDATTGPPATTRAPPH